MNAQKIKDEMRGRIRESCISPDTPPMQHQLFQIGQLRHRREVLRVSPTTRLPTKYDRIFILPEHEEMTIRMQTIPTNSPPINMRQLGSAEHVLIGKPDRIHNRVLHPAPKMLVSPSEDSFDPSYEKAKRRRKRTDRLVSAYNNEWWGLDNVNYLMPSVQ